VKKISRQQKLFSIVFTLGFFVILFYTGKNIPVAHGDLASDCASLNCQPGQVILLLWGKAEPQKYEPCRPPSSDSCYGQAPEWTCTAACPAAAPPPADPPPVAAPPTTCTEKANGKKVEITYAKYSSTGTNCTSKDALLPGIGFQYYYNRTPDTGACTNGKCVGSEKVECGLDQTVGDKQIMDAAIAFAKVQPNEDVYINGKLVCDITPAATNTPPPPPGPPCAKWKDPGPESGVCEMVATSLFQGKDAKSGDISTDPGQFIARILAIILSFAGGIALLLIISAGYKIMTSKGKPEAIQQGRDQLISAIVGLVFIIFSFVIFQLVVTDILKIPGIS